MSRPPMDMIVSGTNELKYLISAISIAAAYRGRPVSVSTKWDRGITRHAES